MPLDVLLTRWTIRLALTLYVVVLAGRIVGLREPWRIWDRRLWTAACLTFLVHVACAFSFYHQWSNAAAVADTARQTKLLLGWEFGEGIYFSYGFALLWTLDVVWAWVRPSGYYNRPRGLAWAVHIYLFFIAFNGAIIFESGPTRLFGLVACAALFLLLLRSLLTKKPPLPSASSLEISN